MKAQTKAYKLFASANPIENDANIDKFLAEGEGRKVIEKRHYGSFNMVPVKMPHGILQAGQQQVEMQMMFCTLVIYVPLKSEIEQGTQNLSISN